MFTAILGFLSSLPEILSTIKQIAAWLNKVSGGDPKGFIVKVGAVMAQLNKAESHEERQDAAKAIADLIARLP